MVQIKTLDQYLSSCQTLAQINQHIESYRNLRNVSTNLVKVSDLIQSNITSHTQNKKNERTEIDKRLRDTRTVMN